VTDFENLYRRAIAQFVSHYDDSWLVQQSIPILYSGHLEEYKTSSLRVVTTSLNPSNMEFSKNDNLSGTDHVLPYDVSRYQQTYTPSELEQAYGSYFDRRPYTRWFNSAYESLLQPLGVSYYGNRYPRMKPPRYWQARRNRALHTDILSPLVTFPNWSRLPASVQDKLSSAGFPLWLDLISSLKPHVVLISAADKHRKLLPIGKWQFDDPLQNGRRVFFAKMGSSLVVWGKQRRRPFADFGIHDRSKLARWIEEELKRTFSQS
jgi:hypothetical protein